MCLTPCASHRGASGNIVPMKVLASPRDGALLDARDTMYPSSLEVVRDSTRRLERATSTVYGYVVTGRATVSSSGLRADVGEGGYFALPGEASVEVAGLVVLIERFGFCGMRQVGTIEERGRLSYIDGCSDTILAMPPRAGDPVLNHLHFPSGINQSLHSHPSVRLGVVARGGGIAHGTFGGGWEHPLAVGTCFLLDAHEMHSFKTAASSMDVIAFHPDSDWGPTDAAHPMLNRTYLSAR
jgi:hypothetical protein